MGAKTKSGRVHATRRKRVARSTRRSATGMEAWEQTAQVPDEREDEIDCQRIVQGEGGRQQEHYDDYN